MRQQRGIEVLVESPKEAYIQGVLARGDRRLSAVLLDAHEKGGSKGFKQAMKKNLLREEDYLYRQREPESEILPWKVLDMGLDSLYLERELEEAKKAEFTAPCAKGCTRCGICKMADGSV